MPWIESHQELARHPKTKRLAKLLDIGTPQAIGHLHLLWWWCMDFAQDGDLTRYDSGVLADGCQWEGDPGAFVSALVDAGFLEKDSTTLMVHDWLDYADRYIKQRTANRDRQRKHRANKPNAAVTVTEPLQNTCHANVTPLQYQTIQDQTEQDQTEPSTSSTRRACAPDGDDDDGLTDTNSDSGTSVEEFLVKGLERDFEVNVTPSLRRQIHSFMVEHDNLSRRQVDDILAEAQGQRPDKPWPYIRATLEKKSLGRDPPGRTRRSSGERYPKQIKNY